MTDWSFWTAQLAGAEPETTPGAPHAGFYLLRQRYTWRREPHEHKIGTLNKVATYFWPVAIWDDDSGWHCVITRVPKDGKDYATSHLTDQETIDDRVFSRCCRAAISYADYVAKVQELEIAQ